MDPHDVVSGRSLLRGGGIEQIFRLGRLTAFFDLPDDGIATLGDVGPQLDRGRRDHRLRRHAVYGL